MATNMVTGIVSDATAVTGDMINKAETIVDKIIELATLYGMRVVAAILIFAVGIWVARQLRKVIVKLLERSKIDQMLVSFVSSLSYSAMCVFVVVAALDKLGIKTASFVAILGAAGLAIGLALQGSLSNFASGVLMVIFKPFKVGDFIEAAGISGIVQEIHIFTTIVNTPDNKKIIIPNSKLTSDNITNYTANPNRRVDLVAGIGYGEDIDKARAAIIAAVAEVPNVLAEPALQVSVVEMADSSVNFVVRPWANVDHYWDVYFGVTEAIKKRFDKEGISIPFPQRDIHVYNHDSN